jgi:putative lipase involved disintegration of autophagic bodies
MENQDEVIINQDENQDASPNNLQTQDNKQVENQQIPTTRQLYAKLANASYTYYETQDNHMNINGYVIFPELSDRNSILLYSKEKKELVLSIRGTKVTNSGDLQADVHILMNKLKENDRYKSILSKAHEIAQSKNGWKFILVGHSLGGALAIEIAEEIIKYVDNIYVYNPGFSLGQALESVTKQIFNKIGIKSKAIRIEKELRRKLTIYQSGADPISLLSYSTGKNKYVKPKSWNTHTLDNFTGGFMHLLDDFW